MKVKVYFSKSSNIPCTEVDNSVLKADDIRYSINLQWKRFDGESPSWALVGEADEVILKDGTIVIRNEEYVCEEEIMKSLDD